MRCLRRRALPQRGIRQLNDALDRAEDGDRQLPALKETEGDVLVNRHDEAERDVVAEFPALMADPLRTVRQALGGQSSIELARAALACLATNMRAPLVPSAWRTILTLRLTYSAPR